MSKWIPKILFFLFVIVITYLVATFIEASKTIDFLRSQKEEFINNDHHLIQSTVIANYHDQTNAYVLIDPLYEETFVSSSNNTVLYSLSLRVYAFVTFIDNKAYNSIGFIMDNLVISDTLKQTDEKNRPIVDVNIKYTKPLIFNGKEFLESTETFAFVLDTNIAFFMINHDILKVNNEYSEIKSMALSYRIVDSNNNDSLVTVSNSDFSEISNEGKFNSSFNRDIRNVVSSNIDLLSKVGLNDFMESNLIYFDNDLMNVFNSFNRYYFTYLSIEMLILAILAYFFFFHRQVIVKYKENRKKRKEELAQFKAEVFEGVDKKI